MRYELRLHRFILGLISIGIACFSAVLFWLTLRVGDQAYEAVVSLLVVILVATLFAYIGMAEGIVALYFGDRHGRELVAYLVLGMICLFSALYLATAQNESLQMVSLLAAPHAFLFGVAEIRMAQHLERHPRQRRALAVSGFCEVVLGFALIWGARLPSKETAEILGGVAFMTLLQMWPLLLYREMHQRVELGTQ